MSKKQIDYHSLIETLAKQILILKNRIISIRLDQIGRCPEDHECSYDYETDQIIIKKLNNG